MIDVSLKRGDSQKAIAYLDGIHGRLFRHLANRLGSDDKAQDAIILVGLAHEIVKRRPAPSKIHRINAYLKHELGLSLEELYAIASEV